MNNNQEGNRPGLDTYIDSKGREIGRCSYCVRRGRARNLRKLPLHLDDKQINQYCPRCYPEVLENVKQFPWNRKQY